MDVVNIISRSNGDVSFARVISTWLLLYPNADFRAQVRQNAYSPIVLYQWSTKQGNAYKNSLLEVIPSNKTMNATIVSGSFQVTIADTTSLNIGSLVSGAKIPSGSYVTKIVDATNFLFNNATNTGATDDGATTITITDKILYAKMPRIDALNIGALAGVYDVILEDTLTGDEKVMFGGSFELDQGVTI